MVGGQGHELEVGRLAESVMTPLMLSRRLLVKVGSFNMPSVGEYSLKTASFSVILRTMLSAREYAVSGRKKQLWDYMVAHVQHLVFLCKIHKY